MKFLLTLVSAILLLPSLHAQPTYTNPVLNASFADPAILREPDGTFVAFATQSHDAHIQVARSPDLVHWTMLGDALPIQPKWTSERHKFWAPDVHRRGDTYVMYFAAEPNTSTEVAKGEAANGMCIGMATSHTASGPYTDAGQPVLCGPGFVDIDPMGFDDPKTGKKLLYWGSGFEPLKVQELAPDRLHFAPGSHPTNVVNTRPGGGPGNYRKLIEGAWTTFHDGWYFLFFSGDNCCGPHAHYAVMVARSRSPFGPFELKPQPQPQPQTQTQTQTGTATGTATANANGTANENGDGARATKGGAAKVSNGNGTAQPKAGGSTQPNAGGTAQANAGGSGQANDGGAAHANGRGAKVQNGTGGTGQATADRAAVGHGAGEGVAADAGAGDGVILHANPTWLAPGHNSIATDDAQHDWILYHAINPTQPDGVRVLLLDRITYRHGWPEINNASPSYTPVPAPIIHNPHP